MTLGLLAAAGAALTFAVFQIVNGRALALSDVPRVTRGLLLMGSIVLGVGTLVVEGTSAWVGAPPLSLAAAAAAGIVHFLLGWTFLGNAVQRIGVARAGALLGTVPLFGALLAWAFLGESLVPVQLVGLVSVVTGVAVIALSRAAGSRPVAGTAVGVIAVLGTSLCWAVSPVLIRQALVGIPSPSAAATVGLLASAVIAVVRTAIIRRGRPSDLMGRPVVTLVVLGGFLVGTALWLQWTALDLVPVASALVVLQLTPALVPILARYAGFADTGLPARRLAVGLAAIVGGSLTVILGG